MLDIRDFAVLTSDFILTAELFKYSTEKSLYAAHRLDKNT